MKERLQRLFSGNLDMYKSIPFWSWNNNLDEAELIRQIEQMKSAGIGGFIMHARTGLKEEYLGEKWFSCVKACLDKARELGMQAWIYDENGWPSGFVGGKLLEVERYRARYLEYSVGSFDPEAYAVYVTEQSGYRLVDAKQPGIADYHRIYLRVSPANTDILNADVVDAFIQETHEQYYKRFPESFGRELAGFFTDEPQYYRWATPFSPAAVEQFAAMGENIREGLIWLFVQDEAGYPFRVKYYNTLNKLYTENFYKKLYDWCEAHHCQLTGHSVEEMNLPGQMWGGANVMPSYAYEHIPGIDWLGRGNGTEIPPKQVSSVASQLGIKQVLTETFGCSGYDVTPKELKGIADYQYFNGINLMCQHLYPYSLAAGGKTDHPPVFSHHSNWFEHFKTFNDYFTRLGCLIANTEEVYDVAIIHPIRGAWLDYLRSQGEESIEAVQKAFDALIRNLRKHGVLFQFVDETLLEKYGTIENDGRLRMGKQVYDKVIVPDMKTIGANTYHLLTKFTGKLLLLGALEYVDGEKTKVNLSSNTTMEEIYSLAKFSYSCPDGMSVLTARTGDAGDFLFVKNLSNHAGKSTVTMPGISEKYVAVDILTLQTSLISDTFVLDETDGVVLMEDPQAKTTHYADSTQDITKEFQVTDITENYLVMDYAKMKKPEEEFGNVFPVSGLFESLLREDYKGEVTVEHTFALQEKMPLTLIMERAQLLQATVNGKNITFNDDSFDVNFVKADISSYVQRGENTFQYTLNFYQHEGVHYALFDPMATESLRNCLYYDVTINPVYLRGDFTVNKDHCLVLKTQLPPVTQELYKHGYPFFKGCLTLEGEVEYTKQAGQVFLGLNGRFAAADVTINGYQTELVLDTKADITDYLQEGANKITIELRSSLRNLFGPHHYAPDPEPMGVGPYHFEFRGAWLDNQVPKDYTHTYNCVPFGVDEVYLSYRKPI